MFGYDSASYNSKKKQNVVLVERIIIPMGVHSYNMEEQILRENSDHNGRA